MKRLPYIIGVGSAVVAIVAGMWSFRVWRQQQRTSLAAAAIPEVPDLSRWPAAMLDQVQAATAAVRAAKDMVPPLGRLAVLYYANGFWPEAGQALAALRQLEPTNARWAYLMGDVSLRRGDAHGAELAFRAAAQQAPSNAVARIRLGDVLAAQRKLDEADESYSQAILAAPNDLRAEFARISFRATQSRGGDQRGVLQTFAELNPDIMELHDLLSRMNAAAGDERRAVQQRRLAARAARHLGTNDPWIDELVTQMCFDSNHLGLVAARWVRENRFAEAETLLTRAIKLAPSDPRLRSSLAEVYVTTDLAKARAVLEAAVVECPDDPAIPEFLSRVLRQEHKPDEALAVVSHALQRWPTIGRLHAALGYSLRDGRKNEEAVTALREAVHLDGSLVEAHVALGYCLHAAGKGSEAKVAVEKAISIRPDYAPALLLLGTLAIETGDLEGAERHIAQLYSLQPDEPGARVLYADLHLREGRAAAEAGRLDEAAQLFAAGLEAAPELGALLHESALVAMRRSEFAQAVDLLQRYLRVEPNDLEAYASLGEALIETNRWADARKILLRGRDVAQKSGTPQQADEFTLLLQRAKR